MSLQFKMAYKHLWCDVCQHRIPEGTKYWFNPVLDINEHCNCDEMRKEPIKVVLDDF